MGFSTPIARLLTEWFGDFDQAVLLVTEWGIWPSSENRPLYYAVRRGYGDGHLLHELPGHVFMRGEEEQLVVILDIMIRFGWGGVLFKDPLTTTMAISHDEFIDIDTDESTAAMDEVLDGDGYLARLDRDRSPWQPAGES